MEGGRKEGKTKRARKRRLAGPVQLKGVMGEQEGEDEEISQ